MQVKCTSEMRSYGCRVAFKWLFVYKKAFAIDPLIESERNDDGYD
jgi:hypothetical protein